MRHTLLTIMTTLSLVSAATAQDNWQWCGRVTDDATGLPIAGATIAGTADKSLSCMSDEEGDFLIVLPRYIRQLEVGAPDYQSTVIHLPQRGDTLAIKLQQRSAVNAAAPLLSLEDGLLSHNAGGMRVIGGSANPAQGATLLLNGIHSINGGNGPLIVLDGIVLDQQHGRTLMHQGYVNNVLSAISPDDIEKVSILQHGTALYGAKGGNGVIIIDTKRAQSMATRIEANLWSGMEWMPQLPQMMNATQYRSYAADVLGNTTSTPVFLSNDMTDMQQYAMYHNDTDWSEHTYQKAMTQHYGINVQGGDMIAKYNLGINYTHAQSTLVGNDFDRLSLRFNTDIDILEPLDIRLDVAYSNTGRDLRDDGIQGSHNFSPGALALVKSPLLSPYMTDKGGKTTSTLADADIFGVSNPLSILHNGEATNKNSLEYSLFTMNVQPRWRISRHMTLTEQISYVLNNITERYFLPDEGVPNIDVNGDVAVTNEAKAYSSKQESLMSDTRLTWHTKYGAHDMEAIAGFRYLSDTYNNDGITANNSVSDKMPNITSTMENRRVSGTYEQWKSTALYIVGNYSFADRYRVEASLTGETSTRYGKNADGGISVGKYVWALFPSLQASWDISSEQFFRRCNNINLLRMYVGIDQSGNDNIPPFASRTYFAPSSFINSTSGLTLQNIGNDKLRWETTRRIGAGVQLSAFNNRLGITGNVFQSDSDHLLLWKELDGISGMSHYLCNEGAMGNIGFNMEVDARILRTHQFTWDIRGGISSYKNRVKTLAENNRSIVTAYKEGEFITAVNAPVAQFFGYKTDGVFASSAKAKDADLYLGSLDGYQLQAGDPIYQDINNDHIINEQDKQIIGNPNPDFFGSFGTTLSFLNMRLDAIFTYNIGGDIYNYNRRILEQGNGYNNQTTALLRRWICEGQETDIPRAGSDRYTHEYGFTNRWIEDSSYMKLKRISLSYYQSLALSYMQGFTLWIAADDMLTLTRYLGSDPEVSCSRNALFQGVDTGLLGDGRSVSLGIKINL